jgi:hypothetical protein
LQTWRTPGAKERTALYADLSYRVKQEKIVRGAARREAGKKDELVGIEGANDRFTIRTKRTSATKFVRTHVPVIYWSQQDKPKRNKEAKRDRLEQGNRSL